MIQFTYINNAERFKDNRTWLWSSIWANLGARRKWWISTPLVSISIMSRLLASEGGITLVLPAPKRLKTLPGLPRPNRIQELLASRSEKQSAAGSGSDSGINQLIASDHGDLITGIVNVTIKKVYAITVFPESNSRCRFLFYFRPILIFFKRVI